MTALTDLASTLRSSIGGERSRHDRTGASSGGLSVTFESISRHYQAFKAVDDVSLAINGGEFLSLLGPSGSGKTTLLMMLAGFEKPTHGRIRVSDKDITALPSNKRNIGMVFQRYALFPHMTVAENIAFPLRRRGMPGSEIERRVASALDMVQLQRFAARKPAQLSGGQQQRVALARAIVFNPSVILMDEPLGALDKKLRLHLQVEIKSLQRRLETTLIYVTHDQEEALSMSDRVAVLNHGRLMQCGCPSDLYFHPTSRFVADFVGEMNFIEGVVEGIDSLACRVRIDAHSVDVPRGAAEVAVGNKLEIGIRPERITLGCMSGEGSNRQSLTGTVVQVSFNGPSQICTVQTQSGQVLKAYAASGSMSGIPAPGSAVTLSWQTDHASLYPSEPSS